MSFWPLDTAGKIADVCSAVGLIVTVVLTAGAWQVKRCFERIILYPQHVNKLDVHCAVLNRCVGNYAALQNQAAEEVARIRGDINSLRPYLRGMAAQTLRQVVDVMETYQDNPNEANLRKLLAQMYQLLTEMQNLSERLVF